MRIHLHFTEQNPNYNMLKEIFNFIDSRKIHEIIASFGMKHIYTFINYLKIIYLFMIYNLELNFVVVDLKNYSKLRKEFNMIHVPSANAIQSRLSRYDVNLIVNIVNRLLKTNFKRNKRGHMTFLVDATPVDVDINFLRKKYSKEKLKTMDLKWSYSSSKGSYIGYKVTVVLDKKSLTPVLILIHAEAPHDSKLFKEILEKLKRSRIIRPLDILIFDKDYYSYNNYKIGIIDYRIIPLIFPKKNMNKNKMLKPFMYPLELFNNTKRNKQIRKEMKLALKILLKKIK